MIASCLCVVSSLVPCKISIYSAHTTRTSLLATGRLMQTPLCCTNQRASSHSSRLLTVNLRTSMFLRLFAAFSNLKVANLQGNVNFWDKTITFITSPKHPGVALDMFLICATLDANRREGQRPQLAPLGHRFYRLHLFSRLYPFLTNRSLIHL